MTSATVVTGLPASALYGEAVSGPSESAPDGEVTEGDQVSVAEAVMIGAEGMDAVSDAEAVDKPVGSPSVSTCATYSHDPSGSYAHRCQS